MQDILNFGSYKTLAKTRYVNDKQITDHYAIIPTGQGYGSTEYCFESLRRVCTI